jgi:hypothetical protein
MPPLLLPLLILSLTLHGLGLWLLIRHLMS